MGYVPQTHGVAFPYSVLDPILTVVLTSHNPQHAYFVADKVALILGHENYLFGEVENTMSADNLRQLYDTKLLRVGSEYGGVERQAVVPIYD